jgi:hypothetical protein
MGRVQGAPKRKPGGKGLRLQTAMRGFTGGGGPDGRPFPVSGTYPGGDVALPGRWGMPVGRLSARAIIPPWPSSRPRSSRRGRPGPSQPFPASGLTSRRGGGAPGAASSPRRFSPWPTRQRRREPPMGLSCGRRSRPAMGWGAVLVGKRPNRGKRGGVPASREGQWRGLATRGSQAARGRDLREREIGHGSGRRTPWGRSIDGHVPCLG